MKNTDYTDKYNLQGSNIEDHNYTCFNLKDLIYTDNPSNTDPQIKHIEPIATNKFLKVGNVL